MKNALAASAVSALLRALSLTWRTDAVHGERYAALKASGEPVIFALWHGRMLVPIWRHRGEGIATMASKSGDGEIIAQWLSRNGYLPVGARRTRAGRAESCNSPVTWSGDTRRP
jgi:lysophospholipid acyltransferase (LPLAT)-like uncharacterized protein